MKNKKFLAGLLACICCFESAACIPVIAEDSNPAATEAAENLSEIEQACEQIQANFPPEEYEYTITCNEAENTISVTVQYGAAWVLYKIRDFCTEKRIAEKYTLSGYFMIKEGKVISESDADKMKNTMDYIAQQITDFIEQDLQNDDEEMQNYLKSRVAYGIDSILILAPTQEKADKIKAFCDENGLTEKYDISYVIVYQQVDVFAIPEMNQVIEKINKFIESKNYSGDAFLYEDQGWGETIIGLYIHVWTQTREELDVIEAYCKEQGFTEKYDIGFAAAEEIQGVTEMETDFTAGDVTMDDSVDILDVITVNKAVLGKETLTTIQNKLADINRDGKVDASDALEILKQVVGLTE